MIYFLKPEVSRFEDDIWNKFYDGALKVLINFKPDKIISISNLNGFSLENKTKEDLLIFFVPNNNIYRLSKIIEEAKEINMDIFPVSIAKDNRMPSEKIKEKQSFDIITEKKLRGLDDNFIKIIGECFGREVIISQYPAFFNKKLNMFISHKRKDGEDEACYFKESLHPEKEHIFIDLHEVRAGQNAQEKIEDNLTNKADILIFVQTKLTFESHCQLIEIKKAFELGIPILWITLGLEKNEYKKLLLYPVGNPHFEIEKFTKDNINEIINYAFEMIRLKKQRLLDDVIYRFKSLKEKGISYKELCDKNNLYLINRIKNTDFGLETEKLIFKCLCREYEENDLNKIKLRSEQLQSNSNTIYTNKGIDKDLGFRTNLKTYSSLFKLNNSKKINGGIIISGSFPDNLDFSYHQNIIDAISVIIENILQNNGKIIFGSHPTFQGLILEKAKKYNTCSDKNVKLYVSKQFKEYYESNLKYFKTNSEVHEIEIVKGIDDNETRSLSLTKMREAMINDSDAKAVIVIGGKEAEDSLTSLPGIDEEIQIAKENGIPIFVIGSTGGRSMSLINEGFENPIKDKKKQEELSYGNNFRYISEIILNEIS